jgi:hypothetical protein
MVLKRRQKPLKMDLTDGSETSAKAFEDGPHRGFRNVGKKQSDAGRNTQKNIYNINE